MRKDRALYYAFSAKHFDGRLALRDLESKRYRVMDMSIAAISET